MILFWYLICKCAITTYPGGADYIQVTSCTRKIPSLCQFHHGSLSMLALYVGPDKLYLLLKPRRIKASKSWMCHVPVQASDDWNVKCMFVLWIDWLMQFRKCRFCVHADYCLCVYGMCTSPLLYSINSNALECEVACYTSRDILLIYACMCWYPMQNKEKYSITAICISMHYYCQVLIRTFMWWLVIIIVWGFSLIF